MKAFRLFPRSAAVTSVLIAGFALTAVAQSSFTGRWVAEMTTPGGDKRQTTFFLQQNGDSLTGAVLNGYRMQNISDGKVNGEEATWAIKMRFGGQERSLEYHAKLAGDHLTITMPASAAMPDHRANSWPRRNHRTGRPCIHSQICRRLRSLRSTM